MSDEINLPQIIQALSKLSETHQAEKQTIRDEYCEANLKDKQALERAEWIIERRDSQIELLRDVIFDLCHQVSRAKQQLNRDNQNCIDSDPLEILNLLPPVVDPVKVIEKARSEELGRRTGLEPLDETPASPDDICHCGHQRKVRQDATGLGGAQCRNYPGDSERSWRHEFSMKFPKQEG